MKRQLLYILFLLLMVTQNAWAWDTPGLSGGGSSDNPYLIQSASDWNILANYVNDDTSVPGFYFRQTADISVTTMVGIDESKPFIGTYDGDGHTLTINYNTSSDYTAPFRYIQGATFKNLKVTGNITTTRNLAAGIAGLNKNATATFEKCVTDITINSSSTTAVGWSCCDYHGGFLAHTINADVSITDCVCGGSVNRTSSGSSNCASFVGLAQSCTVTGTRCLSTTSYTNVNKWNSLCHSDGATRSTSVFYYVNANDDAAKAGEQVTASQLADGTIFTALQAGRAESIWAQDPVTNQPMLKLFANDGKLPGDFSVNPTKQVRFSQGNLQYQASTNRWRIAEHQYDYVGDDNKYISDSYSGWIDLFGWGTSGNNASGTNYQPWSTSTTGTQYGPAISSGEWTATNSDWGVVNANQLGSYWCVLTNAEWGYLFNTRTTTATINATSNARYTQAIINTDGASVGGIILFPDNFDGTASYSGVTWGTINAPSYGSTTCTTAGWSALEEAGCVFLPATGYRDGSGMKFVGTNCHYWASTAQGTSNAYNLDVDFNVSNSVVNPQQNYSRHYGFCVRLVYETPFLGSGTEADPYLISSEADWNLLADKVSTGYTYSGEFFRQTANINVTTMVGNSDSRPFSGTYDGGGYTISVNLTNNTSETTAPFRYIRGATIKNLHTTGSINTDRMYAAGIVGRAICDNTIINCSSDVFITTTRSGDGTDAGLVGAIWGDSQNNTRTTLTGCVFTGKLLGSSTNCCGGLVGWCATNLRAWLTIENCLYAPQERTVSASSSKTFSRGGDFSMITITNSYYTETLGDAQGKQARSISAGDDMTISIGEGTEYNVSNITAYAHGIKYGSTYYAGNGDEVTLSLSHAGNPSKTFSHYAVIGGGTLSAQTETSATLTMTDADQVINAKWAEDYPIFPLTGSANLNLSTGNFGNTRGWEVPSYESSNQNIGYVRDGGYADGYYVYNGNEATYYSLHVNIPWFKNSGTFTVTITDVATSTTEATATSPTITGLGEIIFTTANYITPGVKKIRFDFHSTNTELNDHLFNINNVSWTVIAGNGKLPGEFTVNAGGGKVQFAQGNLQYQASTNTWRFADNQYDNIGYNNRYISSSYSGWIDLFGWGTSGYNHGATCYQPWSSSTTYTDYYPYGSATANLYDGDGKADWGYNAISNGGNTENSGWRTPKKDEWVYLFNTRETTSGIRYAKATVNGVTGVILLPDDWDASYYTLNSTNVANAAWTSNTITAPDWAASLEAHGAVFLPTSGNRDGAKSPSSGFVSCWSSNYEVGQANNALVVYIPGDGVYPDARGQRSTGNPVRLVLDVPFLGAGTEDTPYLISSEADWNLLADKVNSGTSYAGKYFRQTANINVTTMVGVSESKPFSGTYDGDGKTMNLNLNTLVSHTAPFRYIVDATIKNVITTGTVHSTNSHLSGLVGIADGNCTIQNCRVSADVGGAEYSGGIVGHCWHANISIIGCVYSGTLSPVNNLYTGGIIGWGGDGGGHTISISNCLFAGSVDGSTHFHPIGTLFDQDKNAQPNTKSLSNTYYTLGAQNITNDDNKSFVKGLTYQGKFARTISAAGNDVTISGLGDGTRYDVSDITAYAHGIKYGSTYYAGNGDEVSLTLSHSDKSDYTFYRYTVTGGASLANPTTNTPTLTMTDADQVINAQWIGDSPNWTYSSSGNVLSAYGEGGYTAENPLSITISAPADLQFDGNYKPATISNTAEWTAAGLTVPTILYNGKTNAPSLLGTYTASISTGEATAEVTYTIKSVINYQSFFDGGLTRGKNFDVVSGTGAYEVELNNTDNKGVYWDSDENCAVFDGEAYLQIDNPLGNVTAETGLTLTMEAWISSDNNGSGSFIRSTGASANKNGWQRLFDLSDGNPEDCIFINAGNSAHLMWCLRKGYGDGQLEVRNNTSKSYFNQWSTITMVVAPGGYTTLYVNGEVLTHSSLGDVSKIINVLNYISGYDKCYLGTSIFEASGSNADGFFIGKIRGFQTAEGALMPYYDGTNYHYLLSYATNGGNPITGTFEATIPEDLPTPTHPDANAVFLGWYTDEELTTSAVSGTALTRNTALYAKWTKNVASVTTSGDVTTYYTTFSDALTAWEANSTLKLLTNIETSSTITVSATSTLDLNGYGIKMTGTGPVIRVGASKTFTLNDSNPTAAHKFSVTDNLATLDEENGTLVINGGYITGGRDCRGSAIDVSNNDASNFIMNAGTLIGNNNGNGDNLGTVCVARDAYEYYNTFTMNGGAICYNNAVGIGVLPVGTANINGGTIHHNNGAGIRMWRSKLLTLNNVEITNNTASGILVDAREAAIQVQGRTIITDNTLNGNPADVNYDRGDENRTRPLAIVGALHSEARIGIYYNPSDNHSTLGGVFTSGLSSNGDASNFFSNLSDYGVKINSDGEALLAVFASVSDVPTAKTGLAYNGSAQALVNAGTAVGGTMKYSLDNSTWSSSIPTATNAGNYTVYYMVEGDATHTDYIPSPNTVDVTYSDFQGNGAEGEPYLIPSAEVWDYLADKVNSGISYAGKYFQLTADIGTSQTPITRMVGVFSGTASECRPFSGNFDGNGHTLTVDYSSNDYETRTALFSYVKVATIRNLIVAGNCGSAGRGAGIVGESDETDGPNTITNCVSSITISGELVGGISLGGNVNIEGSLFNGTINGTSQSGGFVGWGQNVTKITNSLFAPQAGSSISGCTFYYTGSDSGGATVTNSYYTTALGDAQGKLRYTISGGTDVTVANAGTATEYNVSGITSYGTGILYGGKLYAGDGDEVSLNLSHADAAESYSFGVYNASSGTLSGSDNPYTLTMGSNDVVISAAWLKILTSTNITIESVVYDGSSHTAAVKCDNETLTKETDYTVATEGSDVLTNAGSTTFTITGIGGYTGTVEKTFTITPKALTITANAQTITYGGNITSGVEQVATDGLVTDDALTSITLTKTQTNYSAEAYANDITPSNAVVKRADNTVTSNYDITYVSGALTIGKATLTATVQNAEREVGADNPTFTVEYTGFVNNETSAVVTTQASATCDAIATSPVGDYSITASGAAAANYDFDYVPGTLTIYRNFAFSESDWKTWYGAEDLSVDTTQMEAYVVTEVTSSTIIVESTNGKIYLNKPMLIKRKNSNTTDVRGYAPASPLSLSLELSPAYIGNVNSFENYTAGTVYTLAGTEFIRTRVTATTEFDPSKCFIYLTSGGASSRLSIGVGGTTGVIPMETDDTKDNWYTISGRKLSKRPKQPGVYIWNGKKVIIK